ncbi:hypothetical protein BKA69DRAFT_162157 [Paraphysoderma sedebokerense]|nr:hypothetical protein BKA69DRAFT_162157 [Paraphysoderma sedebokerense]
MAKLKLSVVVLLCLIASFSVQSIYGLVLDKRQEGGAVGEVVGVVQSVVSSPPPSTSAPSQQTETPKAPPPEDPPVSTTPSPPADSPTPPPATSPSPPPVVVPEPPKEPAPAPALPKAPKKKERPQPPFTPPNPLPPATPANPPAGQPANPQPPVQPNPGQNQGQQAPATPKSGDGTLRQASVPPPGTSSSAPAGGTPAGGSQNAPNSDPNTPNGGGNPSPSSPEIASPKIPVPVSDSGPSGDQKGDLFNVGPGSPDSAGQTSQGGSGVVIVGTIIGVVIAAALVSLFVNRSRILNAWKKDDVKKGTKGSASKPRVDSFPTFPVLGSYGDSKNERPETFHSFGGNPAASDLVGSNVHGNREEVVSGVAQELEFQRLALSHIPGTNFPSD